MTQEKSKKIRGLVGASGAAGGSVGSTDKWTLVFDLVAWITDNDVSEGKLRCEMPISKAELKQLMANVKAYSVVEFRIVETTKRGVSISDPTSFAGEDTSLTQIRDALQIPVKIDTPTFGVLELDRRLGEYSGKIDWCGVEVRLSLSCIDHTNPAAAITAAESLFNDRENWTIRIKEFVADRLLELKNDGWLEEGEPELSRNDFISKIVLQDISVDESRSFSFYFDDGDLFWGHSIVVSGDVLEGLRDADIAG